MNKVLILGAGLVTKPMVDYLLGHKFQVTVASRTVSKAEALIQGRENGITKQLNAIEDQQALSDEIAAHDIIVSLLPATHHVLVAKNCLKHKKNMVTTSYVSPAMKELDEEAKQLGLILLNECGVDPGIDHMSAKQTIDRVESEGGKIVGFASYCGGLPAIQDNNNPFGYKFSWSPRGVVVAGTNNAKFMKNNKIVDIPGEKLFENYNFIDIPGVGTFEAYPNRDSLSYISTYNLKDVKDMFRGTLRNIGHCETWRLFAKTGILNDEKEYDFSKITPAQVIEDLIGKPGCKNLAKELALYLDIPEYSVTIHKMKWLDLFSNKTVPLKKGTAMDLLVFLLENKLKYYKDEVDMIVMQHEFDVEYTDRKCKIIANLIAQGIPGKDSAMSRTVSLPAAIGVRLIATGKINLTGVQIPVVPEIYNPILEELEKLDIKVIEH